MTSPFNDVGRHNHQYNKNEEKMTSRKTNFVIIRDNDDVIISKCKNDNFDGAAPYRSFMNDVTQRGLVFLWQKYIRLSAWECDRDVRGIRKSDNCVTSFMKSPSAYFVDPCKITSAENCVKFVSRCIRHGIGVNHQVERSRAI